MKHRNTTERREAIVDMGKRQPFLTFSKFLGELLEGTEVIAIMRMTSK